MKLTSILHSDIYIIIIKCIYNVDSTWSSLLVFSIDRNVSLLLLMCPNVQGDLISGIKRRKPFIQSEDLISLHDVHEL